MKFATRINSFLREGKKIEDALREIAEIKGISHVDLNYPEHFTETNGVILKELLGKNALKCNAINLRFRNNFLNGELGNVNKDISIQAKELCKQAMDVCKEIGGEQVIVWLGYDGFDYSFQMDYTSTWTRVVEALKEICAYSDIPVSIEYKPYEERTHALIDSFGTTMLMLQNVGAENLGVTLDFCHMLMKKENPAFAAALLLSQGRLYNMHLNDGEGSCDDGLMVGMVHFWKTLEIFYYLKKYNFQGAIYFDTFPKREEAKEECNANIKMSHCILEMIDCYGMEEIEKVIQKNDAVQVNDMMITMLMRRKAV